jgi:hypothetical protein
MKLSVVRGGGLAGVVTKTEVASDAMSPEDASALHDKVAQAGLLEPTQAPPSGHAHPDELSYELTVEHAGRHRTLRVRESSMPEAVRALVAWTDSRPERKTTIERPGRPGGHGRATGESS